ncbi:hypothetical protein SLEP1_g5967 [Rubroshorea leprosula]|uniref:TNase-like domain-containing protein n=1 Tax=Rubroshorea leprosula TaxID=152421 RepID=A0AAV5HTZ7_9ROSI|nr:hypothetical protein SLEP1_g5967 [Rubroshorea leprosula]
MYKIGNVVGKVLKLVYGRCFFDPTTEDVVSVPAVEVPALVIDLSRFETTSQVPEGLSKKVVASKRVQAEWYRKLLEAWKDATPPPKTREEAARLVIQTLEGNQLADVEGILAFYGLPLPAAEIPTSLPEGVQFELHTLAVDAKDVGDGDGMTVYVSMDQKTIPIQVRLAVDQRSKMRAQGKYKKAELLHRQISNAGYRIINHQDEEILAQKHRIRLRGIDAPELSMPYGNEAKDELVKLVQDKCLRLLVYGLDQYARIVADVYCDDIFVQEKMLKRGFAWHYKLYDQRLEFDTWEKEARGKQVGLWASPDPEEPWEWKKRNRREGS